MSVMQIEEFRQKNGADILKVYTKPTKNFPEGNNYFYCPARAVDLIQRYSWYLNKLGKGVMVVADTGFSSYREHLYFHRELFHLYSGYYADYIDHVNHVEIDNTLKNLNDVSHQQNMLNTYKRGYAVLQQGSYVAFNPQVCFSRQVYNPFGVTHCENEACHLQYVIETDFLQSKLGNDYYQFDFTKYRRGSEDILDLERTGKISEEEAIYRHLLKYADNAWFVHRYNLFELYKYYNIPIPSYSLDSQGFMVHPITGQKLCPFEFKPKNK